MKFLPGMFRDRQRPAAAEPSKAPVPDSPAVPLDVLARRAREAAEERFEQARRDESAAEVARSCKTNGVWWPMDIPVSEHRALRDRLIDALLGRQH